MNIENHGKPCICGRGAECKGIAAAFFMLEDARGGHTKIPRHVNYPKAIQEVYSNQWRKLMIDYVSSGSAISSEYIANHHFHPHIVEAEADKTSPGTTFKMPMTISTVMADRLDWKFEYMHAVYDENGQPTDRVFNVPLYNFAVVKEDLKKASHRNVVAKNFQLVELQDSEEKQAKASRAPPALVPGAVAVAGGSAAAAASTPATARPNYNGATNGDVENGMRNPEKDVLRHGQFSSFHKEGSFSSSRKNGDDKKTSMEMTGQFETIDHEADLASLNTSGDGSLVHASMVVNNKNKRSLVEGQEVMNGGKELTTVHAKQVMPWYKRRKVIMGLILSACVIIGIAVGVSVGVSNKNNGGSSSSNNDNAMSDVTLVMLMDYQPEQVGWKLVCDDQVIHDIPTGTYGLLGYGVSGVGSRRRLHRHGGRLIDNFRVEYTTQVPYNSTCVFNITDSGGDGLQDGFYELYYGNDVAATENLMEQIAFEGYFHVSQFQAVPPNPQRQLHLDSEEHCSICPGGEAVPDRSIELDGNRTCGEADDLFSDLFSDCPLDHDLIHECGCTNQCDKLCRDGSTVSRDFEDKLVKVENGRPVTCEMAQEKMDRTVSRQSDCLRASYIGETFCGCPKEREFCHVCPDNKSPTDLTRELVPGVTCEGLSGIGYSLPKSDERFAPICPACQGLGEYCGCPEGQSTNEYCRLCGGANLLPELGRIVFFALLNITTTCIHVEFQANVNSTEIAGCAAFQEEFGALCC